MTVAGSRLDLAWCLPFVFLLLNLALLPLWVPKFWGKHWAKITNFHAAVTIIAMISYFGFRDMWSVLVDTLLNSYIAFLAVIASLFMVASGIRFTRHVPLEGTPFHNTLLLFIGSFMASWMGTAGASLLFIRPLISSNSWRVHKKHIFIFAIFTIANVGGSLTPLGDPPLFMGYINGIPFFWFYAHLAAPTYLLLAMLLSIFYAIDTYYFKSEDQKLKGRQVVLSELQKKLLHRVLAERGPNMHTHPDPEIISYRKVTSAMPIQHESAPVEVELAPLDEHVSHGSASVSKPKPSAEEPTVSPISTPISDHAKQLSTTTPDHAKQHEQDVTTIRPLQRSASFFAPITEREIREAFSIADEEGVGHVSIQEVIMIGGLAEIPFSEKDIDSIKAIDRDKDGHLDYEEFRALVLSKFEFLQITVENALAIVDHHRATLANAATVQNEQLPDSVPDLPRRNAVRALFNRFDEFLEREWRKRGWMRFVDGWRNIPLVVAICLTTLLTGIWASSTHSVVFLLDDMEYLFPDMVRDLLLFAIGGLSYLITSEKTRELNDFHWGPLEEVAIIFAAIFTTMIPPILILQVAQKTL